MKKRKNWQCVYAYNKSVSVSTTACVFEVMAVLFVNNASLILFNKEPVKNMDNFSFYSPERLSCEASLKG